MGWFGFIVTVLFIVIALYRVHKHQPPLMSSFVLATWFAYTSIKYYDSFLPVSNMGQVKRKRGRYSYLPEISSLTFSYNNRCLKKESQAMKKSVIIENMW